MQFNAASIAAVGTVMAVVVTLLAIVGTGVYRLGELSNQVENLSIRVDQLHEETRRDNEQLLHLLANHTHDENGNAVFTVPPGSDPTGANLNPDPPTR